ncbi:MAG: NADH-quinone oxidoreductase subunit C [Planctomyces sp.]|jgi:NADH-quinone oxidoreductase subunit C|nr:NADH-quinone oxidoreductase subunit C [Planctomycetia bacterium]HAV33164.1 NADH-quinone oxidoreductase subunit C [Planctomycetaceae bacterium]HBC61001.1 NADH-quinone oxidoreductase subunit C [Planctomycetaceae bacterium]
MDIQQIHGVLLERFGEAAVGAAPHQATDPWIQVAPEAIVAVSRFLHDDPRMLFHHLNDLCGVDYLEPDAKKAAKFGHEPHVEVVYHLSSLKLRQQLKLKVSVPRWKDGIAGQLPVVPSVSSVWGIANWHEREAYDLVGIWFEGHPNLRRILCPEDWTGHALRKDYEFPLEYHGVRGR